MNKFSFDAHLPDHMHMSRHQFRKFLFLSSVLDDGWDVRKRGSTYTLSKKRDGRKEVLEESYLEDFIRTHSRYHALTIPSQSENLKNAP
jgi:hypothetical protein